VTYAGRHVGFAVAFGFLMGVCASFAEPAGQKKGNGFSGRFDPSHGRVIAVDDAKGNFLWTFAVVLNPGYEAEYRNVRYFVQPVDGGKNPELVYEDREQGMGGIGTIFPDGSMMLATWNQIVWAKVGEAAREVPTPEIEKYAIGPVAIYPDGIVAEEYRPSERGAKTWWIPIDAHQLKMKSKVQLDVDLESSVSFVRHGETIAWINAPQIYETTPKSQRKRPTFCRFEVTSGKVERLPVKVDGGANLAAFDGKRGVGGGKLIDATSGEVKPIEISGEVIGMFGDSIYAITSKRADFRHWPDAADVVAVTIDQPGQPRILNHIDLTKLSCGDPSAWVNPRDCVLWVGDGLRVWDGEHWAAVAKQ
jgi:hypothetical protein